MDRRRFLLRSLAGTGALSLFNSTQIAATHAQVDRQSSGRTFQLEARPAAITIDTSRTAVLVIDMTNDFGERAVCSNEPESTSL